MIFSRKQLLFARHDGCWHALPHTLIDLEKLPESIEEVEPETVRAIYLTALDMAAGQDQAVIELFREPSAEPGRRYHRTANEPALKAAPTFPQMPRADRLRICASRGLVLMRVRSNIP